MNENQSLWKKIGIIAIIVIIIAALLFFIKYQYSLLAKQEAIQQSIVEMKQLQDGIVRNQSQYVSKNDLEKFAKDSDINLDPIRKDLNNLGANIQGISIALSQTPGFNGHDLSSTKTIARPDTPLPIIVPCPNGGTVQCPNYDLFGYLKAGQVLQLNEPLSNNTFIPFGQTTFNAWKEHPWDLQIYSRIYSVTNVLGQDDNGRHYVYSKFTIASNGKTYTVPINDAKFVEEFPTAKFRVSPRLYLGSQIGVLVNSQPQVEFTPLLEVMMFSYGITKSNPDWTFLGLGLGYESQARKLGLLVTPFTYNIGRYIPLVNNMYIGSTLSLDTSGNFGILGGIHVGL